MSKNDPVDARVPTSRPTQGRNERFHQTLFRWLDKQPLASSIAELQEQVDAFEFIYNTERPHQGLPGRITPQQAWDATPVAEPPRQKPADAVVTAPTGGRGQCSREVKVQPDGYVCLHGIKFQIAKQRAGQTSHAVWDETGIVFADANSEILIEHGWPPKGQTYVSNGIRRGRPSK